MHQSPVRIETTSAAHAAIQRWRDQQAGKAKDEGLRIGAPCKNNACDKSYSGPESDETPCIHHPGQAVFHEGMKYWSCCQKKTSNFNAFLQQGGCSKGKHQWSANEKVDHVRVIGFRLTG
ncbi:unnamed protein product [Cylicocyclus nassatus]|uniref:CHORD domain-containing protein n=1 Tax=Cylicocyclus nassatus TaxID=53992 RepID=A0AA36HBE3_CYLNA|nr:unnamed protein product [Cylicocyclus nassatus]